MFGFVHYRFALVLCLLLQMSGFEIAWADCIPQRFFITLVTPLSSRINKVGDPVQALLVKPLLLQSGTLLPAGTRLAGRIIALESSINTHRPGRLRFQLTHALTGINTPIALQASPDTEDRWLGGDPLAGEAVVISPQRSTRLLNQKLRRRLSSDLTVWNQVLGINRNSIPDTSSDTFMLEYHRNDLLLGTSDHVRVVSLCP